MNDIKIVDLRHVEESSFTTQQLKDNGAWVPVVVVPIDIIRNSPFILERTGRWIGVGFDGRCNGKPVYNEWECSECSGSAHGENVPQTHPYCNYCGAKMIL